MSPPSAAATTRSDVDDDDLTPPEVSDSDMEEEEEEEEEVEVEEEEEEIIEVEEEVYEDLTDSPDEFAEDQNDVSKEMELEGHDSHLGSGSSNIKNSETRLPSDTVSVGESRGNFKTSSSSNETLKRPKEESCEDHRDSKYLKLEKLLTFDNDKGIQESKISIKDDGPLQKVKKSEDNNELHTGGEAHFCNSDIVHAEGASPSSVTRKYVGMAFSIRGRPGEGTDAVLGSEEEVKQTDMHSGDDKQRMASRSASPAIRTRSLLSGAKIIDGNKHPAVICEFFAKGWCIKGNLCKFLHVKEDVSNPSQQPAEDVASATVKTEVQFDEERIPPQEQGESKKLPQFQENHNFSLLQRENISSGNPPSPWQPASSRDDAGPILSFKDGGKESLRQHWPADDYAKNASLISRGSSPVFKNNLFPEYRSSSSGLAISSSNYHNGNPSSYVSSLEDRTSIRSQYLHSAHSPQVMSHAMNSSLSTSGPAAGSLPSYRISAWTGTSLPFNSSSLKASPLGAQKLLDSDRECHTSRSSSLLRSSSPFSGAEPEKPSVSADYKTKISSNDWEPSVPFRPSFFIPHTIFSSSGSLYDPLHDSFDLPNMGDLSSKVSLSSVGTSTINMSQRQIYGDSILSRTMVPECNGDKNSVSHDNTNRAEAVGTSVADGQNGTMPNEDDTSVSAFVKDTSKSKNTNINQDTRHQINGSRRNKDLKIDRVRQNSEVDVECKLDGDGGKESKAMRHFRAGLVDLVKELLKPTWREGLLSKDAHNTIVKKAVDKVLSVSQPHQVPTTMESVKHYLSASQPKIAKLVEGYVEKYGKS